MLVSGAAGATGSVVCQLGKIAGAKVIALAGTPEKCEWLEREVGVDKAVNYKSPNFRQEFSLLRYIIKSSNVPRYSYT